jgi:hypothetical protein
MCERRCGSDIYDMTCEQILVGINHYKLVSQTLGNNAKCGTKTPAVPAAPTMLTLH